MGCHHDTMDELAPTTRTCVGFEMADMAAVEVLGHCGLKNIID